MCVILSCKAGKRPTTEEITECWYANPDGGGFMYPEEGKVIVSKGYMHLAEYLKALSAVPAGVPLVMHMRIGTSGGYDERVTHPFPVTSDLEILHALDVKCTYGIAHNGILRGCRTDTGSGVSDTISFVRETVYPLANSRRIREEGGLALSKTAKKVLARESAGSRLAIMDGNGNVRLIGAGWITAHDGVRASNDSFRKPRWDLRAPRWNDYYGVAASAEDLGLPYAWDADDFMLELGCASCVCYEECACTFPICLQDFEELELIG